MFCFPNTGRVATPWGTWSTIELKWNEILIHYHLTTRRVLYHCAKTTIHLFQIHGGLQKPVTPGHRIKTPASDVKLPLHRRLLASRCYGSGGPNYLRAGPPDQQVAASQRWRREPRLLQPLQPGQAQEPAGKVRLSADYHGWAWQFQDQTVRQVCSKWIKILIEHNNKGVSMLR